MKLNNNQVSVLLFISFSLIYLVGSFSKIPFGDSIGFVLETEKKEFVLASAPHVHSLFINTLVFLKKLFPTIESSEICRFLTVISASLSIVVLFRTISELIQNNFFAIISAIIFGFSFSFWKNAEIIEVYTFNLLFVSLVIYFCTIFILRKKKSYLIFSAFLLGLSLWIHIQNILIIPAFMLVIFLSKNVKLQLLTLGILGVLFCSLFIFPLLNSQPLSSVFSSGTVSKNIDLKDLLKNFITSIGYLIYNFWYFLIFSIFGVTILFKSNKKLFIFFTTTALPVFIFSTVFAVSDNYVYFIPFNLIVTIFIGIGLYHLHQRKFIKTLSYSCILIPLFYFFTLKVVSSTEKGNNFHQEKLYKGGLEYYLLPWMKNNVGIVEFTIDKKQAPENIEWMSRASEEFINIKSKYQPIKEIRKL